MKPEQLNDNDDVFGEGSKTKNSVVTEEEVVDGVNTNIPPFLRKISEIVDDPESDPIVSWSVTRDSFVVWDSQEFSKNILPNYFKHSNFLSFIHQLNTYGFRKVDSYRWEFANEAFQGGKKHLLKNIKRRSKCNKLHQGSFNSLKPDLEDEVEKLKKDLKLLKVEIPKLRQQHENSHIELCNVEERIRCAELKQHQMLGIQFPVSFPKAMNTTPNVEHRHQGSEQLSILQSELIGLLSEIVNTSKMESLEDELCSSRQGLRAIVSEASFAYDVMSEKLMGESSVVDEEVYVNDSNIYLELEDLISKNTDWIESASELVGQTS